MSDPTSRPPPITRRAVLASAAIGAAGLALPLRPRRALAADPLSVTPLAGRLAVLAGAGGNVLVMPTDAGQVVVDSGAAEHSDAVLATLAELPAGDRVHTLVNTHWHLDQVGGNAALGRAGARIVAHEKTRLHIATGYYLPDERRYRKAMPAEAHPARSFYDRDELGVGGERIELGYLLEAHTDGDLYVRFVDANVIAVGDAVSPARDPALDWFGGGWIGGRVDALARLLEIVDDGTRVVPSYGPVIGRGEVQAEHEMMLTLFERMVEMLRMGLGAEDMLAEGVMDGLGRTFDDPLAFVDAVHRSLWAHHNTLSHDIV